MKLATPRPYADPEAAARKLIGQRMTCSSCGAPAGNIVPNWHDRKASFWKQR